MTDLPEDVAATASTVNIGMRALVVLGAIAMVVGAIAGFSGNAAAKKAGTLNGYLVAMGGSGMAGSPAIDEGYAWMWFGIISAILGALMLIATLVVTASSRQRPLA